MSIDITKCKRVRVRKPKNRCEYPGWPDAMDAFDGRVVDVKEWATGCAVDFCLAESGHCFRDSWCEPVDETEAPTVGQQALRERVLRTFGYSQGPEGNPEATGETRLSPPYGLLSEQAPKPRGLYRSAYCRRCGASAEWGCMCPRGE